MALTAILGSELYAPLSPARQQQLIDVATIEGFAFDHELALNAIGTPGDPVTTALNADPTVLSSTLIRWGTTTNGVELTGSGFGPVSTLAELKAAIANGIASGAFTAMTIYSGGQTVATLSFAGTAMTVTSGNQVLTLSGALPTSVQDVASLLGGLAQLSDPTTLTPAELSAVLAAMSAYDLTEITLDDGGARLLSLSLGTASVTLSLGGAVLELAGSFPTEDLGAALELLNALADAGRTGAPITSLGDLSGLTLDGLTLTGADGTVLATASGGAGDPSGPLVADMHVHGGPGADTVAKVLTGSDLAQTLDVNLGGGNDRAVIDTSEMILDALSDTPLAITQLHGGAGAQDTLRITDEWGFAAEYWLGAVPVVNLASGQFYFSLQGAFANFYNYVSEVVGLDGFERFLYETPDLAIAGGAANETVVYNLTTENGAAENVLDFWGGAGIDTLDMTRVDRGDGSFGLTRAEALDLFTLNTGVFGLNSTLSFFSYDVNPFVTANIHLTDVENLIFKTASASPETVSVAGLLAGEFGPGFQLGTSGADVLRGSAQDITPPASGGQFANNELIGMSGNDFLFGDGLPVTAVPMTSAQVYRLYRTTLDRDPDLGGHQGWTTRIYTGQATLKEAAQGFVNSAEFQNTYGTLTDSEFIDLIYRNVLGRAPGPVEIQNWLNKMVLPDFGRVDLVIGLSNSPEFINAARDDAAAFAHMVTPTDGNDAAVFRFYLAALERNPDLGGFGNWLDRIAHGTATLETVANGFVNASEFTNLYGALDDTQFINQMYLNVLGRSAGPNEVTNWLTRMAGGDSRADVLLGFANSQEFIDRTEPMMVTWMQSQGYTVATPDDRLVGGTGENVLSGGLWSDTFVFEAHQPGSHTVLDYEPWDFLFFEDFSYASPAEALAHMTQNGENVVFSDQGTTVTLLDTTLAEIDPMSVHVDGGLVL